MCEILLCVKDMGKSGNLAVDSKAPKQGDVIDVHEDGWAWGDCEMGRVVPGNPNGNHPFFRIIKLPNVTVGQASRMLSPEINVDPQKPSPVLQHRAFFLDQSKIPAGALKAHWDDDARTTPFVALPFNAAQ